MIAKSVRIVLVEPEYEINLGHCARAIANFGFSELYLVNPQCNHLGFEAKKYSKHALEILEKAKVVKSLKGAVKGCSLVIGTSGILNRHKGTVRNPISSKEIGKAVGKGRIAILFGREGIGLREKEIDACDLLVHIPTHRTYSVMNISHALAIMLYEISALKLQDGKEFANERERKTAIKYFTELAKKAGMRNPRKTSTAFKRLLGRANPTKLEINCVLGVLRRIAEA